MMTNYFAKIRQMFQTGNLRIWRPSCRAEFEAAFHRFKRMELSKSNLSVFSLTWL